MSDPTIDIEALIEGLSRWRALPSPRGGWRVMSEAGVQAPPLSHFDEHQPAQERADQLNRAERYKIIGVPDPLSKG